MAGLTNPFDFEPACRDYFVGRQNILARWRQRLAAGSDAYEVGKSWMVIAPGGLGKTSLMLRMKDLAEEEFNAWTLFLDLGHFREINSPADLFETLDTHLPPARRVATRLRQWFKLPPDAPTEDLLSQVSGELLNQVIAFSIERVGGMGIRLPNLRASPHQPEGIAARLVQTFNSLALLSEEQPTPVVVFLDQIGKCHDHQTWLFIAGLFLDFVERLRNSGVSNLIFVCGARPERKGELEHKIRKRGLFSEFLYDYIDLDPFSVHDAVQAITVRGKPYIQGKLADLIVNVLEQQNTVDPYTVQLGAMAVWACLHRDNETHSPRDLEQDPNEVRRLVLEGHAAIVDPVRHDPVQWEVLKLLSFHPGGLNIAEIVRSLPPGLNLSLEEVRRAINALMNQQGYRLLTETRPALRYLMAHDLLRDYITSQIPATESQLESARKILSDGVWRYKQGLGTLSEEELAVIWLHRESLEISSGALEAVAASCLFPPNPDMLISWLNDQSSLPLKSIKLRNPPERIVARRSLSLAVYYRDSVGLTKVLGDLTKYTSEDTLAGIIPALKDMGEVAMPVLGRLAKQSKDEFVRLWSAEALGKMGDMKSALQVLVGLAQQSKTAWVRLQAVLALTELGELDSALPMLVELAQESVDEHVCLQSARSLGESGNVEAALPVLSALAQSGESEDIRMWAANALGGLGVVEVALQVLSELAQQSLEWETRKRAIEALEEMGEAALPALAELAQQSKYEDGCLWASEALWKLGHANIAQPELVSLSQQNKRQEIRSFAAEILAKMGEVDTALPVLAELAQTSRFEDVRQRATEALGGLGEAAHSVLTGLALHNKKENIRLLAATALGQLGDVESALTVLARLAQGSRDEEVRQGAIEALGKLGEAALPALAELVQGGKGEDVLLQAARSLGELQDLETAIPVLVRLAQQSEEYDLRLRAAKYLAGFGQVNLALSVLDELAVQSEDSIVRQQTTHALGELGMAAVPSLLKIAWIEPYEEPGASAVVSLARILFGVQEAADHPDDVMAAFV